MDSATKRLSKVDTPEKMMVSRSIPEGICGLDGDLIFNSWTGPVLIEFLRCQSQKADPYTSHPRRYWDKNWRKFVSLWRIARDLKARFFLVNYETDPITSSFCLACGGDLQPKGFGRINVLWVRMNFAPDEFNPIQTKVIVHGGHNEFTNWIRAINEEVKTPAVDVIHCLYCKGLLSIDHIKCPKCERNVCQACANIGWKLCESCSGKE